jgi:RNA polymerase sigma-70 factor (ECF subfamily)
MGSNRYDGLDDYAVKLIRHKARQLVGRAGLVEADRPDLEQELALDLLRRLPRFDAARAGRNTFIARIVEHRVATIMEAQTAGVRDYRRVAGSLDERRPGDDGPSADGPPVLDQHEYRRETIAAARRDEDLHGLRRELAEAIAALPPDLRDLCQRLRDSSVSEVSRETGVPRSTLYDAIGKVRDRFDAAGLAAYLGGPTDRGGRR